MQILFETSKLLLTTFFLIYASWSDYKTREVTNKVWILLAPIGFTLTFVQIYFYNSHLFNFYGFSVGLITIVSFLIFYLGGFGGADAKALICIGLTLPFYPTGLFTPIFGEVTLISEFFLPLTIFSNSLLFAASTTVFLLIYNLISSRKSTDPLFAEQIHTSFWRKTATLITGYKVPIEKLAEKWHLFPLEDIEFNPDNKFKRKLVLLTNEDERTAIMKRLTKANKNGILDEVWVSPGLPMLVFITIGLFTSLFFDNIIWMVINSIV